MKILLLLLLLSIECDNYLFIGDSITAYQNGWQTDVCKHNDANCTNLAVGGKRTKWMLETLQNHLKRNFNYKRVYIYGGINDMFSYVNVDSAIMNIQKMVDLANSKNIEAVVIVGYDTENVIKNTWIKDKIREKQCIDQYILYQQCLTSIQNAKIIPIAPLCETDTHDGIHPNATGHKKISKHVIQYGL